MISSTLLLWSVVVGSVGLFVIWIIKRRKMVSLINEIPGPPEWPIIGNLPDLYGKDSNAQFLQFLSLVKRYRTDGLLRVWSTRYAPAVLLYRHDMVEPIVTSSVNIKKSFIYNFLHSWLGTGLLTSTGAKWFTRRRMLTPTFHFKILEEYIPLMNKHADNLVKTLEKFADGRNFDISNDLGLSTLEVICDTAMGYGCLDDASSGYVKAIKTASENLTHRLVRPFLWVDFIFNRTKVGKEFNEAVEIMHRFTNKIINERRAELKAKGSNNERQESGKKRHRSFLDLLLETSEDGKSLSNDDIREEVDTFVFEGHDTTAMGLCFATYLLGHNPEIQERLQEELDSVLEDGKEVTSEDLKELKYLERIIKEAQRICPSVPLFAREIEQDAKVGEYTLPKGTSTLVFTYGLHRDPEVFPDPEKFDPDRFLPENSQGRSPFAYIPFSAGQRNCIGQKFAMTELKMTLAKFFHKYNVKSLTPRDEMKYQIELVLRPVEGIHVNLTKRN